MISTICLACGADGMRLCYNAAPDYITGDRFQVLHCPSCGSGQTSALPETLGRYYPNEYRQYNQLIARILEVLYRRRVSRWANSFSTPGSAFEVGCGNGLMLAILRDLGWRVAGSERSEAAARIPREQHGLRVLAGGLISIDPAEQFDLLLMIQVLEHLEDPRSVLRTLTARLKPEGKLIIGVPNFSSWQSRFGRDTWFHLDVPRHLHHFTLRGLIELVRQHGLDVESVSFVSPEHDPYGWLQSILNRIDGMPNRLTRLLMRIDRPDPLNLLHLAAGCILGFATVPLSLVSWIAGRGAVMEITCVRRTRGQPEFQSDRPE
jgi:SAM-dependent methyltransferase